MNKLISVAFILFAIISCNQEKNRAIDVSAVEVSVIVDRFEEQFYTSNENTLQSLKNKYPYLFPVNNPDSIWLEKINDKNEMLLFQKTQEVFKDFSSEETEIKSLFQHIKYYHPTFKSPKIITLITDLDYESKVIYADSLLFVSIDMYLGKEQPIYLDFPAYISQNFDKSKLVVDIANEIGKKYFISSRKRQFLDMIVDQGKRMFLIESYLPEYSKSSLMGYSPKEFDWAAANESQIWKFFIENELLFCEASPLCSFDFKLFILN